MFLPVLADVPPDVSIDEILTDLADDGVSAPAGDVDGLKGVVARAERDGVELSVVVLAENPFRDSQLRDIATEVGQQEGGTVLVLSPSWVGTYSDTLSRVTVEDAQDKAYTGNAVASADNFLGAITRPDPPYGLITAALVLLVGGVAAVSYWVRSRRSSDPVDRDVDAR
ncbi:DUF6676 family protein [Rhodococcus sp. NPDC058514]|uniref:Rv1476 family membrane protein n=1 Tax=unclassified Rhodococcus (in: high G+C Gram-positive bacteria) TaxID=192944 RepID=UPI00364D3655